MPKCPKMLVLDLKNETMPLVMGWIMPPPPTPEIHMLKSLLPIRTWLYLEMEVIKLNRGHEGGP